jgi:hypothetical protein
MDIKIFQTFHKDFPRNPDCDWIKSIGVNGFQHEGGLSDATQDHISELNPFYCEMTAQYWAWKNDTSEYVGFYHYRRYLNLNIDDVIKENYSIKIKDLPNIINFLTSNEQLDKLKKLLSVSDVIIPKKTALTPTIAQQYKKHMKNEPWGAFIACLKMKYESEIDPSIYFNNLTYAPICNMYVMKKTIFDVYCKDLFQIIDAIFEQIGTPYDTYNNRYPGFLAERFLGYWLHIHRISTIETPMILIEDH